MRPMSADFSLHDWPLPYEAQLDSRALAEIDLVVMHCTETPDLASARALMKKFAVVLCVLSKQSLR